MAKNKINAPYVSCIAIPFVNIVCCRQWYYQAEGSEAPLS